ncbi:hypothetical protein ACIQXA_28395 [Streptomyces massasporeus]|uniref:hypothetical protein n=1 Tax=Streptomyces massasporeus TaxID=67324 RepID=UPI0037F7F22D
MPQSRQGGRGRSAGARVGGLPGGFVPLLMTHVVLTAAGVVLAGWARTRAKGPGRRWGQGCR